MGALCSAADDGGKPGSEIQSIGQYAKAAPPGNQYGEDLEPQSAGASQRAGASQLVIGVRLPKGSHGLPLGLDFGKKMPITVKRLRDGSAGETAGVKPGWAATSCPPLKLVAGKDLALSAAALYSARTASTTDGTLTPPPARGQQFASPPMTPCLVACSRSCAAQAPGSPASTAATISPHVLSPLPMSRGKRARGRCLRAHLKAVAAGTNTEFYNIGEDEFEMYRMYTSDCEPESSDDDEDLDP